MNNIIFLDVDGVLNNTHTITNTGDILDELCIIRLRTIIDQTNAKIVMSSSWRARSDCHMDLLCEKFTKCGIDPYIIIGKTPILHKQTRNDEIRQYLDINNKDIKNWIAIDDMKLDVENFILIDFKYGLVDDDVEKIIKHFNK